MAMIGDKTKEEQMGGDDDYDAAMRDDAHFFGMWSVIGKEVARKILRQVKNRILVRHNQYVRHVFLLKPCFFVGGGGGNMCRDTSQPAHVQGRT